MRLMCFYAAWCVCAAVRAEFVLTDTDVAEIKVTAEDTADDEASDG